MFCFFSAAKALHFNKNSIFYLILPYIVYRILSITGVAILCLKGFKYIILYYLFINIKKTFFNYIANIRYTVYALFSYHCRQGSNTQSIQLAAGNYPMQVEDDQTHYPYVQLGETGYTTEFDVPTDTENKKICLSITTE